MRRAARPGRPIRPQVPDVAVRRREQHPPNAPTAAASVGVASPNTIEPSTATIRMASGKNDVSSILKISSRSQVQIA